MFFLQRKSDGKYYRNRGYHSWNPLRPDEEWTNDLNDCSPFRTKVGARQCRAVYGLMPFEKPDVWNDVTRKEYFSKLHDWFAQKNRDKRKEYFDSKFTILEIIVSRATYASAQ